MNRSVDRACRGKRPYTEGGAKSAAAVKNARQIWVQAYKCPHCPSWHIGHPPISDQLKRATRGKNLKPRRRK